MAKKAYDGNISYLRRDIDWGVGDPELTEGLPLSGSTVQQYIKDNFNHKAGYFETRPEKGKCYVFATEEDSVTYWTDPSLYADLLLGEFNAINEYSLSIAVSNPTGKQKTLFTNEAGSQKIVFDWDVIYKDTGASEDDDVKCTYTITREGYSNSFTAFYNSNQKHVEVDITDYLKTNDVFIEGETYINITLESQTHAVVGTSTITYKIVNFTFTTSAFDISKVYDANGVISINWSATGSGLKRLYTFIDGVRVTYKDIGNVDITGTETRSCVGLSDGRHNITIYASITFDNGSTYYFSDLYSRDFIIYSGTLHDSILVSEADIPSEYLSIKDTDTARTDCYPLQIYGAEQYVQYKLVLGARNDIGRTTVNVKLDDTLVQSGLEIEANKEVEIYIPLETYGDKIIHIISTDGISYDIPIHIVKSSINIDETHPENVEFFFSADGMSNDSATKDTWTYNNPLIYGSSTYTASFNGQWNWNSTSGWVDNGLAVNTDSSVSFDYQPFANMPNGKTFEIELETRNVNDDNTVICDLSVGTAQFILTANSATLVSSSGVTVTNKFKSEERVRISFVINNDLGTNARLAFVYINGIISGGAYYGLSNFKIASNLVISGSDSAQVWIKQIRVYNIALSSDEILTNYIRYRDTGEKMKALYDKNDIVVNGSFSKDYILKNLKLPVMTVIGKKDGMPAVKWLDTKAGKSDMVSVNILYENPWDPETSFYAQNITMTPQGTSSMVYPKRNYRIYTALKKMLNPDDQTTPFRLWYTHGYAMDSSSKWTESKREGKIKETVDPETGEISYNDKRKVFYKFKAGSQDAVRWTIKADFAESSGTHNTGTARLWNDVMRNATVTYDQSPSYYERTESNGTYSYVATTYNNIITAGGSDSEIKSKKSVPTEVTEESDKYIKVSGSKSISGKKACQTKAQEYASTPDETGETFESSVGEVRTTVDGYPIVMFYQETESSQLVFMGKYNFNNDKSSESIFGFTDIEAFDDAYNGYYKPGTGHGFFDTCTDSTDPDAEQYKDSMQCWELTNSGDNIALYINKPEGGESTDFRSGFEARYPGDDGEATEIARFTAYVKPFADWMVDMRNDASIIRENPDAEISRTYAVYTVVTSDYYEENVKDRAELHDIDFWINDASLEEAGYILKSDKLTQDDVDAFHENPGNMEKLIQYEKAEGSDIMTVQFIQNGDNIYEQAIVTKSNKILSWTNSTRFKDEKWDHFDVFKIAAYYIYLMRFGAVDQTVKNAMFTSEDGRHWYYINYDNDTILGVRNDGRLIYNPTITRQDWDEGTNDYVYAGYESTLWNCLENDDEFMNEVVPAVDDALYNAGLTYAGVVEEFNTNQCDKWCEKIYNQDAQYKYIDSYNQEQKNYLDSMQGSRETHRNWWVSRRFGYYDAKFANTNYTGNYIYFLAPGVTEDKKFKIVAGDNTYYSIGVNNRMITDQDGISLPIELANGDSFEFRCPNWTLQIGSPVNIYSADNIKELDFSASYGSNISQIRFSTTSNSTKLEKLILNGSTPNTSYEGAAAIVNINALSRLKYLDVKNIRGTSNSPVTEITGLNELQNLETFIATGSKLQIVQFATGAPLKTAKLSSETTTINFKELANLRWSNSAGLMFGTGQVSDMANLTDITISKCPKLSNDFTRIYNWYTTKTTTASKASSIVNIDNIAWTNVDIEQLKELGSIIKAGGTLNLSGKIVTSSVISLTDIDELKAIYGDNIFNPANSLYITDNKSVYIVGPDSIVQGNTVQYKAIILAGDSKNYSWTISPAGDNYQLDENTGVITTQELTDYNDVTVKLTLHYIDSTNRTAILSKSVKILKPTYPSASDITIIGPDTVRTNTATYDISIAGEFTGVLKYSWSLDGDLSGLASSTSYNQKTFTVQFDQESIETIVTGTINLLLYKSDDGITEITSVPITKSVTAMNSTVLITESTNPYLLKAINSRGWITDHDKSYYLKEEAALVEDASMSELINEIKKDEYRTNITSLDEFEYFKGVHNLPDRAFYYEQSSQEAYNGFKFTSIVLPLNLDEIPASCFFNQQYLESVKIPNYVKTIHSYAFSGCTKLASVDFADLAETGVFALTIIESWAFSNCRALTELKFPDSLTTVEDYAISSLSGLKTLEFGKMLQNIVHEYNQSIAACSNLTRLYINPENPYYTTADKDGNQVNTIMTTDHETIIRGISSSEIIDGIKNISKAAFQSSGYRGNNGDGIIDLPDSIEYIGPDAFSFLNNIEELYIPKNDLYTEITSGTFIYMTGIKAITIPDNINRIDSNAFIGLSSLETLKIGRNVNYIHESAFAYERSLTSIEVEQNSDSGYTYFNVSKGILYNDIPTACNTGKRSLLAAVKDGSDIVFPADLEYIPGNILIYVKNLPVIDLSGTSINEIGNYGFGSLSDLTEIYLPDTIKKIGQFAFNGCTKLNKIIIKNITAPALDSENSSWGTDTYTAGYSSGQDNKLWVPQNWTGYDTVGWTAYLLNDTWGKFEINELTI